MEMDLLGYETGAPPPQRVTAQGRAIAFRESGYDNQRVLVLVHGVGSLAASWGPQFVSLPQHGLRVIAWDAPGYGGSDKLPDAAPRPDDYAAALGDFVAALGLKRFVLLGHSMGALIAASYCRRDAGAHVEKLILASPSSGYGTASEDVRRQRLESRLADMAALGPAGLAEKRAGTVLSPQAPQRALMLVRAVMREMRPDGYAQAVGMLGRADTFADAPGIAMPTLVVSGTGDGVTPEAGCRRVAEAIAGARYEPIPGAGHACYIEAPGPFDAAVLRFIGAA
ncbi:MAG TPA: alpha/beta fold hydrolase [Stellaceae bacterium]|nr:alpha/beta fold hydrolase [Stellaceae bacterium]